LFDGREVTNLTKCSLCAKREEYDFDWLPEEIKFVEERIMVVQHHINHIDIQQSLENFKDDIHKVVNNLHFLNVDKNTQEAFKQNLWVFDESIEKGKKLITQQKYQQGLIDHGFYEQEFSRKNTMYQQSRDYEFPKNLDQIKSQEKHHWYDRVFRWVGRNLSIINVILGSLSSIISALGAATEFKETIEHAINYAYA